jgi:hypothetical protein
MKTFAKNLLVLLGVLAVLLACKGGKSYPDSEEGLKQLSTDLSAADGDDAEKMGKNLALPDAQKFFTATFGPELGAQLATELGGRTEARTIHTFFKAGKAKDEPRSGRKALEATRKPNASEAAIAMKPDAITPPTWSSRERRSAAACGRLATPRRLRHLGSQAEGSSLPTSCRRRISDALGRLARVRQILSQGVVEFEVSHRCSCASLLRSDPLAVVSVPPAPAPSRRQPLRLRLYRDAVALKKNGRGRGEHRRLRSRRRRGCAHLAAAQARASWRGARRL